MLDVGCSMFSAFGPGVQCAKRLFREILSLSMKLPLKMAGTRSTASLMVRENGDAVERVPTKQKMRNKCQSLWSVRAFLAYLDCQCIHLLSGPAFFVRGIIGSPVINRAQAIFAEPEIP